MRKKLLVAYATNSGSTAEVADAIGKELRRDGLSVDAQPAKLGTSHYENARSDNWPTGAAAGTNATWRLPGAVTIIHERDDL